ncbi:hypothetical protein D3C86_1069270 [compost metagenome]
MSLRAIRRGIKILQETIMYLQVPIQVLILPRPAIMFLRAGLRDIPTLRENIMYLVVIGQVILT